MFDAIRRQPIGDTMIWETRGTVRRPLGHIGIIMAEPGATPHYCFVMDKFDGGVRISTPNGFKVPANSFCATRAEGPDTKWFGAMGGK